MDCPVCNTPLRNIKYGSQSIDVCLNCGGMWFDKDELREVVNSLISENKVDYQTVKEAYRRKPIIYNREKQPIRKCPRCNVGMSTFNYSYDSNIFLDKCPSCGGIWADRGEIKEVAKYIKGNPKMDKFAEAFCKAQTESIIFKRRTKDLMETTSDLMGPPSLGKFILMWYTLFPIPLKDDMPTRKFAKLTFGIIVINILVFIFQLIFISGTGRSYFNFVGVVPSLGLSISRMYTFITSMFVHGGFLHIFVNMYYLWLFGNNIEDEIGPARFTAFYLLCGIIGGLLFCLIRSPSDVPAIGASGAISGVLAAFLILYPRAGLEILWLGRVRTIPAINYLLFWIVLQLISGVFSLASKNVGVAYWAHIGGFISGLILIHLFIRRSSLSNTEYIKS